jgi:competence protein ComEA
MQGGDPAGALNNAESDLHGAGVRVPEKGGPMRFPLVLLALSTLFAAHPLAQSGTAAKDTRMAAPLPTINLNTATQAELEALPGVGARVAARIIDYRKEKGPFKKIEELMNVQGIGEKSFLRLRPQLTVTPAKGDSAQQ